MAQAKSQSAMIAPENLRAVDEKLLDYLHERAVTPNYARKRLNEDEDIDTDYTRQYVQQRLHWLQEHGHVENLLDTGLYELVSDPREQTEN